MGTRSTVTLGVAVTIHAPVDRVWERLRDIASHPTWMRDAEEIRFTTTAREGVGTAFDCVTRLGPVRVVDRMVVTTWRPGRAIAVRHVGRIRGDGVFRLTPAPGGGTRLEWAERLSFPCYLGGPVGAAIAVPVLRGVWRRSLRALKEQVENPLP